MNLYEKLAKIRQLCEVMSKNKSGYGYKYVSVDEILARVTAGMKRYKISLIPWIVPDTSVAEPYSYTKTKATKSGEIYEEKVNEVLVTGSVNYRWINDEDPTEFLDVPWYMTGSQSDPSQAFGSAMTYSLRYFLMQFFQIAALDKEDPDNWRSAQKEAQNAEDKEIAKNIIEVIHATVNEFLAENPDNKQAVVDVVKKYAKEKGKATANYFAIEDPKVASALLEEVNEKFKKKEES